ncbi:helix-turn-helix domain-containing protein [Bacillus sp. FJAT-45066]|uniref:helix-turn-helix domain-containing protein n=1 Tax=Bacillus sp. FJAT-45066 TaxID=2011010 RepID=UPI000BB697FF|nr:helix-turn-helix domain-containing protein [Bacillus sp. FJAT-45066]
MRALQFICLYCLNKFNGERSVSAIYHLLRGKKSSQTIQDGQLFQLHSLFGMLPSVTRESITDAVVKLEKHLLIIVNNEGHYALTEKGQHTLIKFSDDFNLPTYLNGWQYHKLSLLFWKRFSLLIQTLSNILNKYSNFLPVQTDLDTQYFIKKSILSKKMSTHQYAEQVHSETENLFAMLSEKEATILTYQLSGYKEAGLTIYQLAKRLKVEEEWVQILFIGAIHQMLTKLDQNKDDFPELYSLCEDVMQESTFTVTTEKTWRLLNRGFSMDQIAQIRLLKMSTIEDHIVEISLHDQQFSIDEYVCEKHRKEIEHAIRTLKTKQLKRLKEYINNKNINYFHIRLVLTKIGDRIEPK